MNEKLCDYAQVASKLEALEQLIGEARCQVEQFMEDREQKVCQLNEKIQKVHAERKELVRAEEQRRIDKYNEQLQIARQRQADVEQWHQEMLAENANYNSVYQQMSGNNHILKNFVNCSDAIQTIETIWEQYKTGYQSVQTRVTNIMFKKRRQQYEYFVVWRNTIQYYLQLLPQQMQAELNQWEQMRMQENNGIHQREQEQNAGYINEVNEQFQQKKQGICNRFAQELDQLFPDDEINTYDFIMDNYFYTCEMINDETLLRDQVLHMGCVGIFIPEWREEEKPLFFSLQNKFGEFFEEDSIFLPVLHTAENPKCLLLQSDQQEFVKKWMEQYLFSMILRVQASKLTLHIVDSVDQGTNVEFLAGLAGQVSGLFGEGVLTKEQDVTKRLRQINEKIIHMRQEVFSKPTDTIWNCDVDTGIEVVVWYDFPNGITKEGMAYLYNIMREGPACGIYVVMTDGKTDTSCYTEEFRLQIARIKQQCQSITFENGVLQMGSFLYRYVQVWTEESFEEQCKQYAIATCIAKRKEKIATDQIVVWANKETADVDEVRQPVIALKQEVLQQMEARSTVPEETQEFPEKILLGEVLYPFGLFEKRNAPFGVIRTYFKDEYCICRPWLLDFSKMPNLLVTMKEEDLLTGQRFIHHVLWSFLSVIPILKYQISVVDCERKGGSIRPFFDLKEQVPEVFDSKIYTSSETVFQCLQRYNDIIEDRIQSKLGNRYQNILEYNRENKSNPEPLYAIAIFDFPCGFDGKNMQLLLNIMKNGSKCGVYVVMGWNEDGALASYDRSVGLLEQIKETCTQIKAVDQKYLLLETGCQLTINLEKYKECSSEGWIYFDRLSGAWKLEDDYEEEEEQEKEEIEYVKIYENGEYLIDESMQAKIEALMKVPDIDAERELLLQTDEYGFLTEISDHYRVNLERWFLNDEEMKAFVSDYAARIRKKKQDGLQFEQLLDEVLFAQDASELLTIPVGIGDQGKKVSISFGESGTSSHHGLITGATGSGKSSLLHTLIMSAMLRYSPEQLHLYLLDFKNGTEFKIYEQYHLPHIQLLALDSMQEFGESILEKLVQIMEERAVACKSVNAKNLAEYVKSAQTPMPRILVIMDEFQLLYNSASNSKIAKNCAELTKRLVMEGRAFGIHLLMSTQSARIISSLSLDKDVVGQMRIRIGLKCSEEETGYLFGDRNAKQAFAWMRGPIGTAVLNEVSWKEVMWHFVWRIAKRIRKGSCYRKLHKNLQMRRVINLFLKETGLQICWMLSRKKRKKRKKDCKLQLETY